MDLESRDFEKILDAMPETGVYVVREEDRGILYFNERARKASPDARLGIPCHEVWGGACGGCPLLAMGDRRESRSVGYNSAYGGMVDITAVRTVWEDSVPAFVVTVTPRIDSGGYTYRKILHVDLEADRCDVLRSDPEGWQPDKRSLTAQLEQFAMSGAVHPEDIERFVTFTSLENLRRAPQPGQETLGLIYRRRSGDDFRWNLMEVVPNRDDGTPFVILCVKDVHDVLREGLEREGVMARLQAMEEHAYIISSLSTLFFCTYYLDLEQDTFRAVTQLRRVGVTLGDEVNCTAGLQLYANHFIHPDDREEYLRVMNVDSLRQKLRWWQPCVAVEYRRSSEEPGTGHATWSWVRATAVLARTGEDDVPKTAVYVAQDITDGKRRTEETSGL